MIIYIFNQSFPDNSGFAKRCKMEIDVLSEKNDVVVLCRKIDEEDKSVYESPFRNVEVVRYKANTQLVELPKQYVSGFYEVYRNIDLFVSLFFKLNSIQKYYKKQTSTEKIKLHVVSSPLTVPLIVYLIGKIHGVKLEVLEFHDLEPELAKHIKKIDDNNLVIRIEYFLEKWMSRAYRKIIVTSQGQAERIIKRTSVSKKKVFVLPNSVPLQQNNTGEKNTIRERYNIGDNDFVMSYVSTISFGYTFNGIKKVLNELPSLVKKIPKIKLLVVGEGDGLAQLKEVSNALSLDHNVIFTGKIEDVHHVLRTSDVLIIPWEKDEMTETILPTKLFEYMQAKKPIIAPNFGEFKRVLTHEKDTLLFNSFDDLTDQIYKVYENQQLRTKLSENTYRTYQEQFNPKMNREKLHKFIEA